MGSIKNKTKKVLAAFLCLVLAMSLLPAGAMAIAGSPSTDGLELSKEVTSTPDADGVYWLTLEAYTTGDVTTSTSTKPTDIVLVLDQSGSMGDSFGSTKTTRQAAMKDAVTSFIEGVAGKYTDVGNHRIGIVTFSGNDDGNDNNDADMLIGMTYVDDSGETDLINSIDGLDDPDGATRVDCGMTEASEILPDAVPGRDRIVIVFTDGVPTKSNAFNTTVANGAITAAKNMKADGVNVYTVGIFNGADAGELFGAEYSYEHSSYNVPCNGNVNEYWGHTWFTNGDLDIPAANRFLNYVSSNYDASNIGIEYHHNKRPPEKIVHGYFWQITEATASGSNQGYYLTASNSSALNDVFDTISDTITTPTVSLTANSIVRDIIATPFELATDATHEITVSKVPYAGSDTWGSAVTATGITVTPDATTGKVDVTGFDFDANMVYDQAGSPAFGGTKLQIKIPIKLKSGATLPTGVSAGSVPTNSAGSCVIDADGNTVKAFPVPNVALYTVTFYDCNGTSVLSSVVVTPGSAMPSAPDASAAHPDAGYDFDGWDPAYDSSAVVNSDLSFTAQQVKDETDTKTINYTVKYFKDGTEQTADEGSGSDDIWVGDSSAPLSFDPDADKYTGYDLDTTATSIPASFSDGDVINVYYVKSSSDWFTVTFKAGANGTLDGSKDDVVIYEVLAGTAWNNEWVPTTAADSGYTLSSPAWDSTFPDNVTANLVFTLQTKSSGGGGSVPADPAGDTDLELNKEDHIAYVVGYPDGTVHPQAPITRAEVATIFFRMLTDLSRESVWSTTNSFSDVSEGEWYNNAVSTLANAGVLSGYPDGTFKPNAPISRAEFATISTRFYDEVGSYATDAFSDISGHWAKDYINKAAELGLISGYNDGTFLPAKNITRAEAMSIMNNVLERSPDKDHLLDSMLTWSDNMDTEAWYYATVQEATNSHECELSEDGTHEIWTAVVAAPNWAELEEQWADSYLGN